MAIEFCIGKKHHDFLKSYTYTQPKATTILLGATIQNSWIWSKGQAIWG